MNNPALTLAHAVHKFLADSNSKDGKYILTAEVELTADITSVWTISLKENITPVSDKLTQLEGYFVEWDGEYYRSVFPSSEAELAQLHTTVEDALEYFAEVKPGVHVEVLEKEAES